jgi:nicotinate-nucleotide pyrophosphorylase (carboxylating)
MTALPIPVPPDLHEQVERALAEDIGAGDLTAALIPAGRAGHATILTRDSAVVCGVPYVNDTFARIDPAIEVAWAVAEGAAVAAGQLLCRVAGPARGLLTGERTALNFLQLLSATATAARAFAVLVEDTPCRVLDTRKTIPGLRTAQKYAVRVGGGHNHRSGLFDMILIKENHIMAAGSIAQAVASARAARGPQEYPATPDLDIAPAVASTRATAGRRVPVEVEVETLDELRQAIAAGADIALLDEFSLDAMREAVAVNRGSPYPVKLEASGGVTLETIRDIALTGVDYISVGSITKHVHAVDLSMRFEW